MSISTHVLDTSRGVPGAAIGLTLYAIRGNERTLLARSETNAQGRTDAPLAVSAQPGLYEIVFAVGAYFARLQTATFYEDVAIRFHIEEEAGCYHVPLLIAPWGYSTYRGT